ncbi:MAG: MarR family transcriptional regulator [Actinophytocola sp.]|uniref:MarR family winged helix-turn-helix transcriptional regulator n=1 Tax=Actinophytocola sp. TaxID=1872138 RepID=UPI0013299449|nr:MarR family transcriptional regulator [Actinophytocola sp.]MPZ86274.1 MarR family transcriptional regulator [Actinophytocola sp.]
MTQIFTTGDGADSALAVLRAMVGIADSTVEKITAELTLTQFRALRTVAERTPITMGVVAAELAINPSSVTRACERLVAVGLLQRAQNPLNKREILLAPTPKGRQIVDQVDHDRREVLSTVLRRIDPEARTTVVAAFAQFAAAAAVAASTTNNSPVA